jgi:N-succinyldiaminopimelate aminotransferase
MPRHPRHAPSAAGLSDRVYGALADAAREHPGPVYALNVGDTYLEPLPAARAEAQLSSAHPRLHNYANVQGEPALLAAIRDRMRRIHGLRLEPDQIQVMCGATGGFTVVSNTLLDPGDEVLILAPFWPLIRGIVGSRGARAVELPFYDRLSESGFDPEAALRAAITPRTVAPYVNSPNNPSGTVLSDAVVDVIARVVCRHELWLLSDEAYADLWYGQQRPSLIGMHPELAERTIACHTLSKSHALAGARVGFTHGPAEPMRAIRGAQTFLTYCAPRPMQLGAARALEQGDAWVEAARRLYAAAGRRVAEALGLPPPGGGTFSFFDAAPFFRPGEDVHGFLRRCLDAGVLLTPGAASGAAYASWVRLCFTVVPPPELEDALGRLQVVLRGS